MPHHAFVSVVNVLHAPREVRSLATWLQSVHAEVSAQFTDFEVVIVNNGVYGPDIDAAIKPLPEVVRQHVFLLNLSNPVDRNNALMAALDRANGDYTVIFEFDFAEQAHLITAMWEKSRADSADIVYLRARQRKQGWFQRWLHRVFYQILRRYSGLNMDQWAHHSRIISRRALNSLLRIREQSHYLKANYALVGYHNTHIEVNEPLRSLPETTLRQQFRTALVAITSFTNFLRTLLLWIFLLSGIVALTAIANAVKVKFTHVDLFGDYQPAVSGWAFLVVMISVFFAITCLNLYIMSIYLSNIYAEVKNRPLYIIESVKRY
jgi:polyisoprenyl-phosphate glycosyltransferase